MSVKYKIRYQHGLNFVTCSIAGWVDIFSRQYYRDLVLESWRYCQQHKGLQIHAFVFMPNHLHLIVSCRKPYLLRDVMRDWKHFTAKRILEYLKNPKQPESRKEWLLYLFSYFALGKKHKQEYQIWQHDNHPIELFSEAVIAQKLDYIHLNPVRAGLVELPEQWVYSSAPFYAANAADAPFRTEPYVPIIEIVPIWQWFYEGGCRVEPDGL